MKNPYIEKLQLLEDTQDNKLKYDIGHRGGNYGIAASQALELIGATDKQIEDLSFQLPNNIGVYCNYLGGGLRGAIAKSATLDELVTHGIPKGIATRLVKLMEACKERYAALEGNMNNETDEDGETNWEAIGTNRVRHSDVVSAY